MASSPPCLQHGLPGLNGVVPEHAPAGLRHWWARWNPLIGAHGHPLSMNRWSIGLEVTDQLLLLTEQPSLTTGFKRVLSGIWLVARHGSHSDQNLQGVKPGRISFNKNPAITDRNTLN